MSKTLIIIISIVSLIIILGVFGAKRYEYRLKKLSQNRPILTKDKYISYFLNKGFEKSHIETLYDRLMEYIGLEDFYVYPEDDLRKLYGFEDLDDVEFIGQIINKLNLKELNDFDYEYANKKAVMFNAEYILILIKRATE